VPNNFIKPVDVAGISAETLGITLDPRFLSFNYRVTHQIFRKPQWFPDLVFDDGRQTYIVFPKGVLQAQYPAVFDNRNNVINYRVFEHIMILDKLIEKTTLRLDSHQVVIEKKR
jgi:type IV secretion system protein VirB9